MQEEQILVSHMSKMRQNSSCLCYLSVAKYLKNINAFLYFIRIHSAWQGLSGNKLLPVTTSGEIKLKSDPGQVMFNEYFKSSNSKHHGTPNILYKVTNIEHFYELQNIQCLVHENVHFKSIHYCRTVMGYVMYPYFMVKHASGLSQPISNAFTNYDKNTEKLKLTSSIWVLYSKWITLSQV